MDCGACDEFFEEHTLCYGPARRSLQAAKQIWWFSWTWWKSRIVAWFVRRRLGGQPGQPYRQGFPMVGQSSPAGPYPDSFGTFSDRHITRVPQAYKEYNDPLLPLAERIRRATARMTEDITRDHEKTNR